MNNNSFTNMHQYLGHTCFIWFPVYDPRLRPSRMRPMIASNAETLATRFKKKPINWTFLYRSCFDHIWRMFCAAMVRLLIGCLICQDMLHLEPSRRQLLFSCHSDDFIVGNSGSTLVLWFRHHLSSTLEAQGFKCAAIRLEPILQVIRDPI